MDIPEAEGHYKRAIELDPNFAMAYAVWEWCMTIRARWQRRSRITSKAYELSAHVSESERLYISSHYDLT